MHLAKSSNTSRDSKRDHPNSLTQKDLDRRIEIEKQAMGVLRSTRLYEAELNQFRKTLLHSGRPFDCGAERKSGAVGVRWGKNGNELYSDRGTVCVTSGMSLVGSAIVNRLLSKGYNVHIAVQTQEHLEKVMEMIMFEEIRGGSISAVMVDVTDLDSLCRAFSGCSGVFHTSASIDLSGVSGYTRYMADIEAKVAELVIEACLRTESVRKCVFTSSLLACTRMPQECTDSPTIVDERCWSDESLCRDKKLWYALGKTMAERAAWKAATGKNLKLVTVCPAFITGQSNSIAYLKGGQEMLAEGLLATVCVEKVVDAHVSVYESDTACGRYICFDDQLIPGTKEADQLLRQFSRTATSNIDQSYQRLELSNWKLSKLLSSSRNCYYNTYSLLY